MQDSSVAVRTTTQKITLAHENIISNFQWNTDKKVLTTRYTQTGS